MKTVKLEIELTYNDAGQLVCEAYWLGGKRHNPNGPAFRRWNVAGQLVCEAYWRDGRRHNPNGPAVRYWNDAGQLLCEEYWRDGVQYTKEQFEQKMNKPSCSGRTVVIDGVEYILTPKE